MSRFRRLMLLQHRIPTNPQSSLPSLLSTARRITRHEEEEALLFHPSQRTTYRFLDFYQMGNKEAIEKERARLSDELNRGYFADISELKKHGGKISMANKIIIPAMAAVKFPAMDVDFSDGTSLNLPVTSQSKEVEEGKLDVPRASLLCLSFRASSQAMIDSWSAPFLDAFSTSKDVRMYQVSVIESWFLSLNPVKRLLLWIMRKSKTDGTNGGRVYAFGDHYYFRKDLKILNLLTGYIFLVDNFGRIRWQGSGLASQEELASLLSCTSLLLGEK